MPLCEKPDKSCPIEDLASDPDLDDLIQEFRAAKFMENSAEDKTLIKQFRERHNLYDDIELLIRIEHIWTQYKHQELTKSQKR